MICVVLASHMNRGETQPVRQINIFLQRVCVWQGDEVGKELGDLLFLQRKKK